MRAGVNASAGNRQATPADIFRIVIFYFEIRLPRGPAIFIFVGFLV
jgi:hypothetical protein